MTHDAYLQQLQNWAAAAARRYEIPPGGFVALINVESAWNPEAVSPAGAMGLAQLMPSTATELGVEDPFDPQQSLEAGARYLDRCRGWIQELAPELNGPDRWAATLAAYNWGIGNWESAYTEHGAAWLCFAPAETVHYVETLTYHFAGNDPAIACAPRTPESNNWLALLLLGAAVLVLG